MGVGEGLPQKTFVPFPQFNYFLLRISLLKCPFLVNPNLLTESFFFILGLVTSDSLG